jgi:hypothetical protein
MKKASRNRRRGEKSLLEKKRNNHLLLKRESAFSVALSVGTSTMAQSNNTHHFNKTKRHSVMHNKTLQPLE